MINQGEFNMNNEQGSGVYFVWQDSGVRIYLKGQHSYLH